MSAFQVFKILAPVILFLAIAAGWVLFLNERQAFEDYRVDEKIASAKLEQAAKDHNAAVKQTMKAAADIIEAQYAKNKQTINDLATANHQLLDDRLREHGVQSDSAPNDSTSTSSGYETASRYWVIPENTARQFISEAARADDIVEIARSCQEYIKSIPPEFFGGQPPSNSGGGN